MDLGVQHVARNYRSIERYLDDFRRLFDGWAIQLDAGPIDIRSRSLELGDLVVERSSGDRACFLKYQARSDWLVFVLTEDPHPTSSTWCGAEIQPCSLQIMSPHRDHHVRLAAGWNDIQFSVSEALLADVGLLPDDLRIHAQNPQQAQLPLTAPHVRRFAARIDELFREPGHGLLSARSVRETVLEELALAIDLGLQNQRAGEKVRSAPRYDRLVQRAIRAVDGHDDPALTAEQLCRELNVSLWSLQRAFRKLLNVSPYQYLLRRRLCQARRNLAEPEDDQTVTGVAAQLGFPSASAFTQHYQRFFGELPSETIRQQR